MSEPKRSGRQARQAERSQKGSGVGRPYIVRGIPTYDILGEENLRRIEAAADRILAETGIEFRDDPQALDLWRAAGAKVDGLLVKFEPGLLRDTFLDPVLIAFVLAPIGMAVWGVYRTAAVLDAAALRRGRNGLRNADRAFAHGAAAAPDARLA